MEDNRRGLIGSMLGDLLISDLQDQNGLTINISFNGPTTLIVRPDAADSDLVRLTTATAANDG